MFKTVDKSQRVVVGTREDGAKIIYIGNNKNIPNFMVVDDDKEDIPEEVERGLTIDQILKFAQPDDWNLDDEAIEKLQKN